MLVLDNEQAFAVSLKFELARFGDDSETQYLIARSRRVGASVARAGQVQGTMIGTAATDF